VKSGLAKKSGVSLRRKFASASGMTAFLYANKWLSRSHYPRRFKGVALMSNATPIDRSIVFTRLTLTVAEFLALSGIGRTKTFQMLKLGQLTAVRAGRRTLITTDSVIRLLVPELAGAQLLYRGGLGFNPLESAS
jgi:hypothetical protein